jgi:hypothetical protein
MPYICWTGLSYPHSNVPKPRLRSKVFRGRTWCSNPLFPRCCGARRRSILTNQPKQARSKAQLSPPRLLGFVSPDLGSSNHQRLLPEGGEMAKNETVTGSNVHCKQAKHAIREALQMPRAHTTQQDEIKNARRTPNALYTSCAIPPMRSQPT